jgi:hypothetical protein
MVETLMAHHLAMMAGLAGRYTVCLPRSSGWTLEYPWSPEKMAGC